MFESKQSLLFILLLLFFTTLLKGEERVTSPDLETLVKNLCHEDFSVREQATLDLIAGGKETGAKLIAYLNRTDRDDKVTTEGRQRINRILAKLDMMLPEKEKAFQTLVVKLFNVAPEKRRSIIDEIERLDTIALDRLQAVLTSRAKHLKTICTPEVQWCSDKDKSLIWRIRMTNEGDHPIFIAPPSINDRHGKWKSLVPNFHFRVGGPRIHLRGYCVDTRPSVIHTARVLAPGASIDLVENFAFGHTGYWTGVFQINCQLEEKINQKSLWIGYLRKPKEGEGVLADLLDAVGKIYVYPDWSKAQTVLGTELKVVSKTPTVKAGATLEVNVCLENKNEKEVIVDRDWARNCWVAFAHQEGRDLISGTAFELQTPKPSAEATKDDYEFKPFKLAPGKSIKQKIAFTVPNTVGKYFLSAGHYLPSQDEEDETRASTPEKELIARAVNVQVLASE